MSRTPSSKWEIAALTRLNALGSPAESNLSSPVAIHRFYTGRRLGEASAVERCCHPGPGGLGLLPTQRRKAVWLPQLGTLNGNRLVSAQADMRLLVRCMGWAGVV